MPRGIPRNNTTNRLIIHRLKIARGHLDKVIRMSENNDYCIDIVNQSLAVSSALKSVDTLILKNHLETCVASEIKKGNAKAAVAEITKILEK